MTATTGGPDLPGPLYAGPDDEPDRWQLLGTGLPGGEGTTWQARYVGRLTAPLPRAIKMLHRPPGHDGAWPDPADRRRWDDQLAVLRHLDPKRVVRLYSVTVGPAPHPRGRAGPDRVVYLEMEWLDGHTLDALVRGRPATPATLAERLEWIGQAAEAVADLHSRTRTGGNPALHRDVKPANSIIDTRRGLVLIDVSTLRLTDDGADPLGRHTPGYTAPEVVRAPRLAREPRSDGYALGALAVFCLTGQDPSPRPSRATARDIRTAARAAGVRRAAEFADHLTAAVAADPDRRPTDILAWARTLTDLAGSPDPVRHRRTAGRRIPRAALVAGTAAVVVLGTGGLVLARPDTPDPPAAAQSTIPAPTGTVVRPSTVRPAPTGSAAKTTSTRPTTAPDPTAAQPAPSRSPTPGPPAPTPTRASAPVVTAGTIASPADDADTPQCSYFAGTAALPAGKTLILAVQNLDNGDRTKYVQYVFHWETPQSRWSWRGAQFFGTGDSSSGQRQRVELMAVDLATARRVGDEPALAAYGTTLDSVTLHRVDGAGPPNGCVGP